MLCMLHNVCACRERDEHGPHSSRLVGTGGAAGLVRSVLLRSSLKSNTIEGSASPAEKAEFEFDKGRTDRDIMFRDFPICNMATFFKTPHAKTMPISLKIEFKLAACTYGFSHSLDFTVLSHSTVATDRWM